MKTRLIAVGVIKKGAKYLLGRKPKDRGPYPNTWHILGGGINIGEEKLEEALKREVKEEAGIEIKNIQAVSFDEDTQYDKHGELTYYIFLDFLAEYQSGKLTPGDDIAEVKWVDLKNLENYEINLPTQILFRKLRIL